MVLGTAAAGCAPGPERATPPTSGPREPGTVRLWDRDIDPTRLTVRAGESVTWVNDDDVEHQIAVLDGSFRSEKLPPGGRVAHAFPQAGDYEYYCTLHNFMKGTVRVS